MYPHPEERDSAILELDGGWPSLFGLWTEVEVPRCIFLGVEPEFHANSDVAREELGTAFKAIQIKPPK